jgi:ribulose kinase
MRPRSSAGEMQWPSPETLKAQIFKDVARAKRYFRLADFAIFHACRAIARSTISPIIWV